MIFAQHDICVVCNITSSEGSSSGRRLLAVASRRVTRGGGSGVESDGGSIEEGSCIGVESKGGA
jgi:hypothetical protein